ncbi:MAG: sigma factor-like helix-turn-helix DNA-binding protein [Pseudomonadales bacterium]
MFSSTIFQSGFRESRGSFLRATAGSTLSASGIALGSGLGASPAWGAERDAEARSRGSLSARGGQRPSASTGSQEDGVGVPEPSLLFVLRVVEGMSVRDTAQILELNEKTVKTRLFRAKRLLRGWFKIYLRDSGSQIFEFAGRRFDVLTAEVMGRIAAIRFHGFSEAP